MLQPLSKPVTFLLTVFIPVHGYHIQSDVRMLHVNLQTGAWPISLKEM